MVLAQVGPLTAVMESLATAVAAGGLLAAFSVGAFGTVAGWPRPALEARALTDSYVGGGFALVATLVDTGLRYLL